MVNLPFRGLSVAKAISWSLASILAVFFLGLAYNYFREETAPPQNVRVTNLSEGGATVSWTTKKPTFGFVYYSESPGKLSPGVLAFRRAEVAADIHGLLSTVHYVELTGLSPETTYHFLLGTGLHTYERDRLTTLKVAEAAPSLPQPSYGQIKQADGINPAYPAIVTIRREGFLPISGMTNQQGNWTADVANLRTPQGSPASVSPESPVFILEVEAGVLGKMTTAISLDLAQPAPEVVLQ